MPLTRRYFTVFLDDPDEPEGYTEHRVEIRGCDQLRAELEGKRIGVTLHDAIHHSYLWAWASMVRTKIVDVPFKDFRELAIQVNGDEDDEEEVDPTRTAASPD